MTVRFLTDYIKAQMEAIAKHKWIMSQKAESDVGWKNAAFDFVSKGHAADFQKAYFEQHRITAIDGQVDDVLKGDSCLVFRIEAIAHNYGTGKEAVLDRSIVVYCFGNNENCIYRNEIEPGLYSCARNNHETEKSDAA